MTVVHRLASQPDDINSLAGSNLGVLVTVFVSLVGTFVVGFITGWKFTLVVLATALPAIFAASYVRERMEHTFESNAGRVFAACTAFATECVQAIRTVCSLNMECYAERRFSSLLEEHGKKANRHAFRTMVWFALSESIEFLCMGFAFW
jgi:ATP-binding cassette subfamily B (MDR/TAP) protein 1